MHETTDTMQKMRETHMARMMAHAYWMALVDNDVDRTGLDHEDWQDFYAAALVKAREDGQSFILDIIQAFKSYAIMSTMGTTESKEVQLTPCEADND